MTCLDGNTKAKIKLISFIYVKQSYSSLTIWNFLPAVEIRRSLHLRLGLPFNRPLLRIASALKLSTTKDGSRSKSIKQGNLAELGYTLF